VQARVAVEGVNGDLQDSRHRLTGEAREHTIPFMKCCSAR
jgi:hypothetical protein